MEALALKSNFWRDKKVFVTGHTGFKGSWLVLMLSRLGARVHGYALNPPTSPSLFELAGLSELMTEDRADIRDFQSLDGAMQAFAPQIIFHLAAQPLVRESYKTPIETYETNVMGTVNVLEAVRKSVSVKTVVNITTDKCYENQEWHWGYRENEKLGGYDPYSSSKACAEIVTAAYRQSFFAANEIGVATARAGNVIGGGDFAKDRLLPDCIRAALNKEKINIRFPRAIRPWQHVLEPLHGYLGLAEKLFEKPAIYSTAFNFGPENADAKPVEWIVKKFCEKWPGAEYEIDKNAHPHEAHFLQLDISKARMELGFQPRWNLERALDMIIEWAEAYREHKNLRNICFSQIEEYTASL